MIGSPLSGRNNRQHKSHLLEDEKNQGNLSLSRFDRTRTTPLVRKHDETNDIDAQLIPHKLFRGDSDCGCDFKLLVLAYMAI
jgi:hypothetical protein